MVVNIFGGIEGGATKSTAVLMDGEGNLLTTTVGRATNVWTADFKEVLQIINDLILETKKKVNLELDEPLIGLGLSLSGIEHEDTKIKLKNALEETYPKLSKNYYVDSDVVAPIALIGDKGGSVLISGTGSNCLLVNSDGKRFQCGGFGHLLGDEGSGYWISFRAIKISIDDVTGLQPAPNGCSSEAVYSLLKDHFKINDSYDLIPLFYAQFEKSFIAEICYKLAKLALNGDELSKYIFEEAGVYLAKHIQAVYNKAEQNLKESDSGLPVVCVGSVWKDWPLLKSGFVRQLSKDKRISDVKRLSLLKLTQHPAIGAVYLVSRMIKYDFRYSYDQNYEVYFKYDSQ